MIATVATLRRRADRMAAIEAENSAARLAADPLAAELARCYREQRERLERAIERATVRPSDPYTLSLF